jgi:hypothetical protein
MDIVIFVLLLILLFAALTFLNSYQPRRNKYYSLMNEKNVPVYDPSRPNWWKKHYGY